MKIIFKSKSTKIVITLLFCIITIFFLSTIAYSAFSSTMNITGIASSRVEADVRITDFSLEETKNATSKYEEFGKEHISTSIEFKENAYAIYKVEVTNYGSLDVGIYSIEGLPEDLTYELIDYNIKDKLCDDSEKCNSFSKKIFYIKLSYSNKTLDLTLNFNFKVIHNITYINFNGIYPSNAYYGESISVDMSIDSPKYIYVESSEDMIYNYENNKFTLNNVKSDLTIEAVYNTEYKFDYTGNYQTFTVPYDAIYKVELWGAQGGSATSTYNGGKGAYVSGKIKFSKNNVFYIYVGGQGQEANNNLVDGGYNGGGSSRTQVENDTAGGGGGATDIRLLEGTLDINSLRSRIMVAGGGGGSYYFNNNHYIGIGGAGGGLEGGMFECIACGNNRIITYGDISTQTKAAYNSGCKTETMNPSVTSSFGKGAPGIDWQSGGGSGYYGGGNGYATGASGGSSFISGHNGCVAIESSSSTTPRNDSNGNKCIDGITDVTCSYHYSGYKFTDTVMIDGAGYSWTTEKDSYTGMPTHDGTSNMTGNEGNGYAKITLIQIKNLYTIKYTDIEGDYQSAIYKGNDLVVNFKGNAPAMVKVLENGIERDYTYKNGIITVNNVNGNIEIKKYILTYKFDYSGSEQEFTVPYTAVYKIELWGAQGSGQGGKGGYVSGNIQLTTSEKLYVYVGGQTSILSDDYSKGGYNGGGAGTYYSINSGGYSYAGGGATDVRLIGGQWNDFDGLKSRIIIAAGGAGEQYKENFLVGTIPGYGGGLSGGAAGGNYYVDGLGHKFIHPSGATQTSGANGDEDKFDGMFGMALQTPPDNCWGSGGGGGYYGGAYGCGAVGSGGSSFISGHNGCNALSISSTNSKIVHTGQSIHYSGYTFTNTRVIDGGGYEWTNVKGSNVVGMPNYDGTATMTGNNGNGYAKITLLELK